MAADRPDPAWAMAELWRYAHDPDMLPGDVARWAYDYIRQLEGAVVAVGAPLPPLGGRVARSALCHAEATISGPSASLLLGLATGIEQGQRPGGGEDVIARPGRFSLVQLRRAIDELTALVNRADTPAPE